MKTRWPAPLNTAARGRTAALEPDFLRPLPDAWKPSAPVLRRFPMPLPGLGWSAELDLWLDGEAGDDATPPPEAV